MKIPNIETKADYLYHYTDANGLIGIIQNKNLRATDARFLNDSYEIHAGIDKYLNLIIKHEEECVKSSNSKINALADLYKKLPSFLNDNIKARNTYITSFTKHKDNLRQWMSYCPANAGYALAFKVDKLFQVPATTKEKLAYRILDVTYDNNIDGNLTPENLSKYLEESFLAKTPTTNILKEFSSNLIFNILATKNKEFYDENESRLIISSSISKEHELKFRSKSGIIIPYHEFSICTSSIEEIIIGPNINQDLAKEGLQNFLHANKLDCTVTLSQCSLRVF